MQLINQKISFSVIIATYNSEETVCDAVFSVLSQGYQDFEIIIIDDGSTDNTEKVIKEHFPANQVRYYRQENSGPYMARVAGVRKALGKYVCFLDADDILACDYFTTLLSHFQQNPTVDYVHFNFAISGTEMPCRRPPFLKSTLVSGSLQLLETLFSKRGQTELWAYCFVKSVVIQSVARATTISRKSEDLLMLYCILSSCGSGLYIDDSLYIYNHVTKIETASDLAEIVGICEWIIEDFMKRFSRMGRGIIGIFIRSYKNMILAMFDRLYIERKSYFEMRKSYLRIRSSRSFDLIGELEDRLANRIKISQIKHPLFFVHAVLCLWYHARKRHAYSE